MRLPGVSSLNAERSLDPAAPPHADAVNGFIQAGHVMAYVFAITVEFVSLFRSTLEIKVVTVF